MSNDRNNRGKVTFPLSIASQEEGKGAFPVSNDSSAGPTGTRSAGKESFPRSCEPKNGRNEPKDGRDEPPGQAVVPPEGSGFTSDASGGASAVPAALRDRFRPRKGFIPKATS